MLTRRRLSNRLRQSVFPSTTDDFPPTTELRSGGRERGLSSLGFAAAYSRLSRHSAELDAAKCPVTSSAFSTMASPVASFAAGRPPFKSSAPSPSVSLKFSTRSSPKIPAHLSRDWIAISRVSRVSSEGDFFAREEISSHTPALSFFLRPVNYVKCIGDSDDIHPIRTHIHRGVCRRVPPLNDGSSCSEIRRETRKTSKKKKKTKTRKNRENT